MAPSDPIRLPFRWQFIPTPYERDRSVRWTWRAYTHTSKLALQSEQEFDTLSECMEDAKKNGYGNDT